MHKLLAHASKLTRSLFSPRHWSSTSERCIADRIPHQAQHSMRAAASCKTLDRIQSRLPERHPPSWASAPLKANTVPPVRVLRLREGAAERLAIVGRMADVCAELDRLVARESGCG